jgi:hypothetical protein
MDILVHMKHRFHYPGIFLVERDNQSLVAVQYDSMYIHFYHQQSKIN